MDLSMTRNLVHQSLVSRACTQAANVIPQQTSDHQQRAQPQDRETLQAFLDAVMATSGSIHLFQRQSTDLISTRQSAAVNAVMSRMSNASFGRSDLSDGLGGNIGVGVLDPLFNLMAEASASRQVIFSAARATPSLLKDVMLVLLMVSTTS